MYDKSLRIHVTLGEISEQLDFSDGSNSSTVVLNTLFPSQSGLVTYYYLGASTRSQRYLGTKLDSEIYLGVNSLFP